MSLPNILKLISSVGNNHENRKDDVLKVKAILHSLGRFDFDQRKGEPHGIITRDLESGIKEFQNQYGLEVDGRLLPGGETEEKINDMYRLANDRDNEIQSEPLAPPEKMIPGTNIPDKGIPEQGFPRSGIPNLDEKWREEMDEKMIIKPPNINSRMPILENNEVFVVSPKRKIDV